MSTEERKLNGQGCREVDNRDIVEMTKYYEARIEALTKRIGELERMHGVSQDRQRTNRARL